MTTNFATKTKTKQSFYDYKRAANLNNYFKYRFFLLSFFQRLCIIRG